MNILMVSDIFMPSFSDKPDELSLSGAERVLIEESVALSKMGNKVYLLTRRREKKGDSEYIFQGISVLTFYAEPSLKLSFAVNSLFAPKNLVSGLLRNIDIVNFHQPFSAFALNIMPQLKKIPAVYTCHSLGHEEYSTRCNIEAGGLSFTGRTLVIPIMRYLEKYNFKKCKSIRVLSEYTSSRLRAFCPVEHSKIKVVSGGVDEKRFIPAKDKRIIRKKFNIPDEPIVISTLRNMEPRMGIENLIEAAGIVSQYCKSVLFVIGGSGPLKAKLENMAAAEGLSHYVLFTGYVSEKDLPDFYKMSDYFVLPTVAQEGFGLVTVESLACGTPVLGTPAGATPEILSNVNRDLIFSSLSPESIAEGIRKWIDIYINSKVFYEEISVRGRRIVEEKYTWKKSAENLMNLYRSIQ